MTEEIRDFRIVKIYLENGQEVVFLTNLSDQEKFPKELLRELYRLRWTIELCYKKLKQVVQIEYFSGKTHVAIKKLQQQKYNNVHIAVLSRINRNTPK